MNKNIPAKSNSITALRAMALRAKSGVKRIVFGGALMASSLLNTSCDYNDYTEQNDKKISQMGQLKSANQADFDNYQLNINSKTQTIYDSLMLNLHDLYLGRDVMGEINGLYVHGKIETKYPSYKEFENRFLQVISNNDLKQNKNDELLKLLQAVAARDNQIDNLNDGVKTNNSSDKLFLCLILIVLISVLGAAALGLMNESYDIKIGGSVITVIICGALITAVIKQNNLPSCKDQKMVSKEIVIAPNYLKLERDIKTYYPGLAKSIFEARQDNSR